MTLPSTLSLALQSVSGTQLLRALRLGDAAQDRIARRANVGRSLPEVVREAEQSVDEAGDVGLTLSFKELVALDDGDFDFWPFSETGEIYVVTSILDGSGREPEFKTKLFERIDEGDRLPLGDGGMLVGTIENPRWFIDVHMLVMESDGDVRQVGEAIEEARKKSGLGAALPAIGALSGFDPTSVSRIVGAVDAFLGILSGILRENGDDHIATIHDFYLKSQAFGAGRHPARGTRQFQSVRAAYQIDVSKPP